MGKCLNCKIEIPDGKEYCDKCLKDKEKESYLDSLLSSVVSNTPDVNIRSKRKGKVDKENMVNQSEENIDLDNTYSEEKLNLEDSMLDFSLDLEDFSDYDILNEIEKDEDGYKTNIEEKAFIDELYDESLQNSAADETEVKEDIETNIETDIENQNELLSSSNDVNDEEDFSNSDTTEDILNFLDSNYEKESEGEVENNIDNIENTEEKNKDGFGFEGEDDILGLINSMNEEPVEDETAENQTEEYSLEDRGLSELDDLLGSLGMNMDEDSDDSEANETESFSDKTAGGLDNIFSDSLGVVDFFDNSEENSISDGSVEDALDYEDKKVKKKSSFFSKIFGNIKKEVTEEDIEKAKQEAIEKEEKIKAKKAEKAEKKANKGKGDIENTKDEEKKTEKKAKEKKKSAEEKKAEKEKKQSGSDQDEIIEELNEGKINPIGAGIVITFFAICAITVIVLTNTFSYSLSIENATKYYERKKYTQSYEELSGLNIKKKDVDLYDKVKTIMYVNRELDSYNNYMFVNDYPKALDSLFQGLRKYDKYVGEAEALEVKTDLDYIKERILKEMNEKFNLSAKEAEKIKNIEQSSSYSDAVYEVIDKSNIENLQEQDEKE